jgi:hypothetical protein
VGPRSHGVAECWSVEIQHSKTPKLHHSISIVRECKGACARPLNEQPVFQVPTRRDASPITEAISFMIDDF